MSKVLLCAAPAESNVSMDRDFVCEPADCTLAGSAESLERTGEVSGHGGIESISKVLKEAGLSQGLFAAVQNVYKGTSLSIKGNPLGPYKRPMPNVLRGAEGGGRFLMGEVPL